MQAGRSLLWNILVRKSPACSRWLHNRLIVYFKLFQIFFLGLDHTEHQAVPLPHALRVWWSDILLDNLLPSTPTQPAAEEALNFFNLPQLGWVLDRLAQSGQVGGVVDDCIFSVLVVLVVGDDGCRAETAPTHGRGWERRSRRLLSQHTNLKAFSVKFFHHSSHCNVCVTKLTSALSFLISDASSSHCWVYCHLAVFSLSTTWSKWTCFCSSSSFWSSNLLKLPESGL